MTISIEWTGGPYYRSEGLRQESASTATVQVMNFVGIIRSFEAFYRKERLRFAARRGCHNCYAAASSIVNLWIANVRLQREPTNRRFTDEDFCGRGNGRDRSSADGGIACQRTCSSCSNPFSRK